MRMSITPTAATDVDRRLRAAGMQLETAVAFIGCLIVLVADTQSLSLIPLLPQLEKEYSLSPSQASWALSALTLAGAAWAPTLTRLGDKLGMRRLVLASLVVSVLGNLLSAVAHGFPLFVASRAVLGLSAAVPLIYAILRARSTSAGRTNRGVGVITVAIGIGIAVSYLLSGVIIQAHGSVRTVFWVMTALSVVTLAVAWLVLPDAHTRSAQSVDWGGAIGVSAGLVCIVLAITEGNTWQWSSGQVIGLLIGGVAIFGLWALYESRRPNPLINVRRVFNRTSTPAFIVGGLCGALGIYTNLNEVTYLEMPKIVGYGLGLSVLECAYILAGDGRRRRGRRGRLLRCRLRPRSDLAVRDREHRLGSRFRVGLRCRGRGLPAGRRAGRGRHVLVGERGVRGRHRGRRSRHLHRHPHLGRCDPAHSRPGPGRFPAALVLRGLRVRRDFRARPDRPPSPVRAGRPPGRCRGHPRQRGG
jgi:MFS family permease